MINVTLYWVTIWCRRLKSRKRNKNTKVVRFWFVYTNLHPISKGSFSVHRSGRLIFFFCYNFFIRFFFLANRTCYTLRRPYSIGRSTLLFFFTTLHERTFIRSPSFFNIFQFVVEIWRTSLTCYKVQVSRVIKPV